MEDIFKRKGKTYTMTTCKSQFMHQARLALQKMLEDPA